MIVTLSQPELEMVEAVGSRRQTYAVGRGLPSQFGRVEGRAVDNHVIGCAGEFAAAKALGLPWRHNVGTITAPDLGSDIEVRTRLVAQPRDRNLVLISRDKPKIESVFVLCLAALDGTGRRLSRSIGVAGWIRGRDGLHRRFWRGNVPRYRPHGVCFVPIEALTPIELLPLYLERNTDERQAATPAGRYRRDAV